MIIVLILIEICIFANMSVSTIIVAAYVASCPLARIVRGARHKMSYAIALTITLVFIVREYIRTPQH